MVGTSSINGGIFQPCLILGISISSNPSKPNNYPTSPPILQVDAQGGWRKFPGLRNVTL